MTQEELLKKLDEEVKQLLKELDEWDIEDLYSSGAGQPNDLEYSKMLFMKLQGKVPVKQILTTDVHTLGECLGIFDVEVLMNEEELSEEKAKAILLDINAKKNEIGRGAIGILFEEHTIEDILEHRKKGLSYEQIVEEYYPIARLYNRNLTEQDWDLFMETAMLPKIKADDGTMIPDYSFKETEQYTQMLELLKELEPNDIMLKSSWWFDEFDPNRCHFVASKNGIDYEISPKQPSISISKKYENQKYSNGSENKEYRVEYNADNKTYSLNEDVVIEYGAYKLNTIASNGIVNKIYLSQGSPTYLRIEKKENGIKIDHSYTQPRTMIFELLDEVLKNENPQQIEQLKKAICDMSEKDIIDALNEERISGAGEAISNYKYNKPGVETLIYDINTGLQAMNDLYFLSPEGKEKVKAYYNEFGFSFPFDVPEFVKNNPQLNSSLLHNMEERCKQIVKEDPDYDPEIQNEDGSTKLPFSNYYSEIEQDLAGLFKPNIERIVAKLIYLKRWDVIEQLKDLNIKKEELYNLYKTCCGKDIDKMKITMEMLQSGVLPAEDFHMNLCAEDTIPFIVDYDGIDEEISQEDKLKFFQQCSVDFVAKREAIDRLKESMSENDRLIEEEAKASQLEKEYEDYVEGKDGKNNIKE